MGAQLVTADGVDLLTKMYGNANGVDLGSVHYLLLGEVVESEGGGLIFLRKILGGGI